MTNNLFRITDSVDQFKKTATDFHKTQVRLSESSQWVHQLETQLSSVASQIESLLIATQKQAISDANKVLEASVVKAEVTDLPSDLADDISTDEMFTKLRARWYELVDKLKEQVGADQFDARSIGGMAWKLVDGRRTNPLKARDAELIERLYSQIKRFNRLQASKDDWLTYETYLAFIRAVEQAEAALNS